MPASLSDDNSLQPRLTAYGFYYDLDLFSDFTYFLTDTNRGRNPIRDNRTGAGWREWTRGTRFLASGLVAMLKTPSARKSATTGSTTVFTRRKTASRVDKLDSATGTILPATDTEADHFTDTEAGVYAGEQNPMGGKIPPRSWPCAATWIIMMSRMPDHAGQFGRVHNVAAQSQVEFDFPTVGKNGSLCAGRFQFSQQRWPWRNAIGGTSLGGKSVSRNSGFEFPGLIQTKGAEIGARTLALPHLQSTLSLWYLHSDSELQQDGDTGGTIASKQPSDRYGVEWANYYTPVKHLAFDFDIAESSARFTSVDADDAAPGSIGGTRVPEAVGAVISSGITLIDERGFSASLRLRYFGPRDLTSDGIYRSDATLLLNAGVPGYSNQQNMARLRRTFEFA